MKIKTMTNNFLKTVAFSNKLHEKEDRSNNKFFWATKQKLRNLGFEVLGSIMKYENSKYKVTHITPYKEFNFINNY